MMRFLQNREPEFFVLWPRKNKPYVVVGNEYHDIEIANRSVEHQTFVLQHVYGLAPFQYYEGELQVVDCTEYELMKELYIKCGYGSNRSIRNRGRRWSILRLSHRLSQRLLAGKGRRIVNPCNPCHLWSKNPEWR